MVAVKLVCCRDWMQSWSVDLHWRFIDPHSNESILCEDDDKKKRNNNTSFSDSMDIDVLQRMATMSNDV